MVISLSRTTSVSYTHLDVYKRQGQFYGVIQRRISKIPVLGIWIPQVVVGATGADLNADGIEIFALPIELTAPWVSL